jgi:hypothetical protein
LISFVQLERGEDVLFLDFVERPEGSRGGDGSRKCASHFLGQVVELHATSSRERHRPFHRVLELAHVAGPLGGWARIEVADTGAGSRRYDTVDESRNNLPLALLTLGEGWHNNHHFYMGSARQGFFWWEIDVTYYSLRVLSWLRVVRDLKEPPAWALAGDPSTRHAARRSSTERREPLGRPRP